MRITPNKNNITGFVKSPFSQTVAKKKKVKVQYEIKGLKDGEHGFHVHECGDLSKVVKVLVLISIRLIQITEEEKIKKDTSVILVILNQKMVLQKDIFTIKLFL